MHIRRLPNIFCFHFLIFSKFYAFLPYQYSLDLISGHYHSWWWQSLLPLVSSYLPLDNSLHCCRTMVQAPKWSCCSLKQVYLRLYIELKIKFVLFNVSLGFSCSLTFTLILPPPLTYPVISPTPSLPTHTSFLLSLVFLHPVIILLYINFLPFNKLTPTYSLGFNLDAILSKTSSLTKSSNSLSLDCVLFVFQ